MTEDELESSDKEEISRAETESILEGQTIELGEDPENRDQDTAGTEENS